MNPLTRPHFQGAVRDGLTAEYCIRQGKKCCLRVHNTLLHLSVKILWCKDRLTLRISFVLQHFLVLFQFSTHVCPTILSALSAQRPLLLQLLNPDKIITRKVYISDPWKHTVINSSQSSRPCLRCYSHLVIGYVNTAQVWNLFWTKCYTKFENKGITWLSLVSH